MKPRFFLPAMLAVPFAQADGADALSAAELEAEVVLAVFEFRDGKVSKIIEYWK